MDGVRFVILYIEDVDLNIFRMKEDKYGDVILYIEDVDLNEKMSEDEAKAMMSSSTLRMWI